MTRRRVAVLASGGGTNLQALIDYFAQLGEQRAADVVLVASNRRESGALARATAAGIATAVIRSPRDEGGEPMLPLLERNAIDLVICAGYLQLVPPDVTRAYRGRIANVHPAPLPQFGGVGMFGRHVHRAVLRESATESGPTVHFVDDQYDHGATIAHWPVPVLPGDNEHLLSARVLRAEHILLPRVVQAEASERPFPLAHELPRFEPSLSDEQLGQVVDEWLGLEHHSAR